MPHIAILVHQGDDFSGTAYILRSIQKAWQAQGHMVTVVRGVAESCEADLAILHVDMTVVPSAYLALAARYPLCLNRYTADISKRTISRQLVSQDDCFEGELIVKANLNCGGQPEARKAATGSLSRAFLSPFKDYAVFRRASDVPAHVWDDPALVVERFLPERDGDLFCIRRWYFLGDRGFHIRCCSHEPVIKGSNTIRRDLLGAVPDELRQMRSDLGFDFGKFDYTLAGGTVALFDVNRTPSTVTVPSAMNQERCRVLAAGLFGLPGLREARTFG